MSIVRRQPKARKTRKHATGISSKCSHRECTECSMLDCQHDCHESESVVLPEFYAVGISIVGAKYRLC